MKALKAILKSDSNCLKLIVFFYDFMFKNFLFLFYKIISSFLSGKELERINRNAREKRKNYFLGIEPIGPLNFIDLCCVIVLSQDINYDN